MSMTPFLWITAIIAIVGGVAASYVASRHQQILKSPPSAARLRITQWLCGISAYVLLCQIVAKLTAVFILVTFAMLFASLLPPAIGYVRAKAGTGR
ncbi:hypothetical protein [Sphingopyxis kveilinensis]|uniref:hypothetical protein n=1 Tax=Sphingopyxis kveilinensis TaxID=3114367 RepID=UPI0030CA7F3B